METIDRIAIKRAAPALATWVLFFATTRLDKSDDAFLAAPLFIPLLVFAALYALTAFAGPRDDRTGARAKRLEVACQISIFLLHYVGANYLGLGLHTYLLVGAAVVYSLAVALRHPQVKALSGPALLFIALEPAPAESQLALGAFTLLLLVVCLVLGAKTRSLQQVGLPTASAFIGLLKPTVEQGLITAVLSGLGILILYGVFKLLVASRRLTQFTAFFLDVVSIPGLIVLVWSILESPERSDTALWLFWLLAAKLLLVSVWFLVMMARDSRALAAGLTGIFRQRKESPLSRKYNNMWFLLIGSLASTAAAYAYYVRHSTAEPIERQALLLVTALTLFIGSLAFNAVFLRLLGARAGGARRLKVGRLFDSRLLRLVAMLVLVWSLDLSLAELRSSSYSQQVFTEASYLSRTERSKELHQYLGALTVLHDLDEVPFSNDQLARTFGLFSMTFVVLLFVADRELRPFSYFFLRGLVPLRVLLALRGVTTRISRLVRNLPFIGPILQAVGALVTFLLKSFDQVGRLSVGKLFVIAGVLLYGMGAEFFVDRVMIVATERHDPDLLREWGFFAGLTGVKDLTAWRTCLSYALLGGGLFTAGVVFRRTYLRAVGLATGLVFIGLTTLRLGFMGPSFPIACGAALIGFSVLLWGDEAS